MTAPDGVAPDEQRLALQGTLVQSHQHLALQGALMQSILDDLTRGDAVASATTRALLSITMSTTVQVAWTLHGFALAVAVPIRQAVLDGSIRDYPFFDLEAGVALPPGADPQVWSVANTLVVHGANGRLTDLRAAITELVNGAPRDDDAAAAVDGTYFCDLAIALAIISSILLRSGCEWPDPSPEMQTRLWVQSAQS